jgi:hypothetical protein
MNIDEIYSGSEDWLRAPDLESRAEWHLRIESVGATKFKQRDGTEKHQAVLKFFGARKKLGLNITNKKRMVNMFGKETDNWISQEVTLYTVETNDADGNPALGIRIRDKSISSTMPTVTTELPERSGFVSGLPQQVNERGFTQSGKRPDAPKPMPIDERNPPAEFNDEVPW